MSTSTSMALSAARDLLYPHFIDGRALANLSATLPQLPQLDVVMLECRLGSSASRSDLSVGVLRDDRSARVTLQRWLAGRSQAGSGSIMAGLERILARWDAPESLLAAAVPRIGLEFDVLPDALAAALFVGLGRAVTGNGTVLDVAGSILADLMPAPLRPGLMAELREHVAALSGDAYLAYLGCFPARSAGTLRVNIADVAPQAVPDFLARAQQARLDSVLDLLAAAGLAHEPLVLCVDLGDAAGQRVGLEIPIPEGECHQQALAALLDVLVKRRLCLPHCRTAALAWFGLEREEDSAASEIERTVNHVKLTLERDGRLEAKIYFNVVRLTASSPAACVPPLAPVP